MSGWKISRKNSRQHFGAHRSSIVSIAPSMADEELETDLLKGYGDRICLLVLESNNSDSALLLSK